MAVLFDKASSEELRLGSGMGLSYPYALSLWVKAVSSENHSPFGFGFDGDEYEGIFFRNPPDTNAYVTTRNGGTIASTALLDYTLNIWQHWCGIWAGDTDRRLIRDGGDQGTTAIDLARPAFNNTHIGKGGSVAGYHWTGHIAEVAIWDLASWPGATGPLKADAFTAIAAPGLAAGASPLFFPQGLAAYWPLPSVTAIQDRMGVHNMTAYNTPTTSEHPPMTYPQSVIYVPGAVEAPAPSGVRATRRALLGVGA